ncbi:MAG TPA: hypothetical protein VK858_21645, partial [Longimicrobiales bacterium]|nr:hypothetical protein [Longimicrobiales bacterium]
MSRGRAALLCALVAMPGCDRANEAAAPGDRSDRIVTEDEVHVLGTSDEITLVAELLPGDDGRVWVMNTAAPWFLVFDSTGAVERSFGRQGGGPEEFGFPVGLVRGPDGHVWTYDLMRHALTRISTSERRTVSIPQETATPPTLVSFENATLRSGPLWMEASGDQILVARSGGTEGAEYSARLWHAEIVGIPLDEAATPTGDPILSLAELVGSSEERYPGATMFAPYPLWSSCPGGAFAVYDPNENALRRVAPPGEELGEVRLPPERRVPLNAQGLFDMTFRQIRDEMPSAQRPDSAEWRRLMDEQFARLGPRGADVFPEYADLQCTPDSTVWLQP